MKPLVSVIIPIYNVDKYIRQCIESVLIQSYTRIEVILVNDGSTDTCKSICDEFALLDERVKVIHKENGGAADARNVGVSMAIGDYVIFLDGDDLWNDDNALERLMERQLLKDADVLNYSYIRWFEKKNQKQPYFEKVDAMPSLHSKKEQLKYLTEHGLYIASPCNKLIRRRILNDIEFRKAVYSEDIEWCAKLLLYANSMDFVCHNFYLYRQHDSSNRYTITNKKCNDLKDNILRCIRLSEEAPEDVKEALLHYSAFQFGTFFVVQSQIKKVPDECITQMDQYSWILKYHKNNKKLLALYIMCRVIGYKNVCKLVRIIYGKK